MVYVRGHLVIIGHAASDTQSKQGCLETYAAETADFRGELIEPLVILCFDLVCVAGGRHCAWATSVVMAVSVRLTDARDADG